MKLLALTALALAALPLGATGASAQRFPARRSSST